MLDCRAGNASNGVGRMIKCSAEVQWLYSRQFCSGILSKYTGFELFVSGDVGPKEIDYLIRQLELYRENIK